MRIRTLVPALACLAAAQLATAADSVKFDGFVDTYYTSTNYEDGVGTAETGFGYGGKLGVSAAISEKVSAQVDLNIGSDGQVFSRQTYGVWKIVDDVELKTGKFIDNFGWTAAYAPGLYRVNGGLMGVLYGVDQVGVDVKYSKGDLTVAFTLANGYFGETNGASAQAAGQKHEAYAECLDVVYALGDMGSVNLELIRDEDAGGKDQDGTSAGVNVTLTPSKELTIGAEFITQTVNQTGGVEDGEYTGAMVLANYKLPTTTPMSVTGQASYRDIENYVAGTTGLGGTFSDSTVTEYAVALLTNPAGTDKLGANLEASYTTMEVDGGDSTYAFGVAAELLYVF